jgi:hypothetical protein
MASRDFCTSIGLKQKNWLYRSWYGQMSLPWQKKSTRLNDKNLSVETLEKASLSTLRDWFKAVFRQSPPAKASPWVLRGNLAWAIQAQAQGDDVFRLRTRLLKLAVNGPAQERIQFKTGTRLIRAWQGETHEVTVLEKGYWYQGAHFSSLSEIARLITGTRWSGPRFFGVDNKEGA